MEILVNDKQNLLSLDAMSRAKSRIQASFAKFGDHVKAVELTVVDENGSKGGIDKQCRVLIHMRQLNEISVSAKDSSLFKAVASSIDRASRSVGRVLDRRMRNSQNGFQELGRIHRVF